MGTKFCKDCKWVRDPGAYAKCASPRSGRDRTGFSEFPEISLCAIQREAGWLWTFIAPDGRCGKRGRWFEPKDAA